MLTLLKLVENRGGRKYGLYRCVCGTEKVIRVTAVTSKNTLSCGCHRKSNMSKLGKCAKTHGQTGTYLHYLWLDKVKYNCVWNTFEEFYKWISPQWKDGLTLEPINNYYDTNCKLIEWKKLKRKNTEQTCLEKYGTKSPFESDIIKEKIKESNIKKYGTSNPAITDVVKQNTIINNRKKYGVDYPQQLLERKKKQKQYAVDKIGYDSEEWAKHIGVSRSGFSAWVRKYGFDTAINMTRGCSSIELIIRSILDDFNIDYINNKQMCGFFPDFIIPDYNLIIEADGLYWHSDAVNKNYKYHQEKLSTYESNGYKALFFREDEIINKQSIISSIILNQFNRCNKIFARKCKIVELDRKDRKDFFNLNHLMGSGSGRCYALEYNNNIVCALRFVNRNGIIDISRFCNILNTTVIGGYSRLINHVIKKEKPLEIHTFVDRRYGSGKYLENFGFIKTNESVSFVWVKNERVFHRLKYRGNSGYQYGCYKLWDCGQAKYIKKAP